MQTCLNCKELNGEAQTHCFKCKKPLKFTKAKIQENICPKCEKIYSHDVVFCIPCGERLVFLSDIKKLTLSEEIYVPSSSKNIVKSIVSVWISFIGAFFLFFILFPYDNHDERLETILAFSIVAALQLLVILFINKNRKSS